MCFYLLSCREGELDWGGKGGAAGGAPPKVGTPLGGAEAGPGPGLGAPAAREPEKRPLRRGQPRAAG